MPKLPEGFFPVTAESLPFWQYHLARAFAGKRVEITHRPLLPSSQAADPAPGEYFIVAGARLLDTRPPTVILTSTAQDKTFVSLYRDCGIRFDLREVVVYRPKTDDIVTLTVN